MTSDLCSGAGQLTPDQTHPIQEAPGSPDEGDAGVGHRNDGCGVCFVILRSFHEQEREFCAIPVPLGFIMAEVLVVVFCTWRCYGKQGYFIPRLPPGNLAQLDVSIKQGQASLSCPADCSCQSARLLFGSGHLRRLREGLGSSAAHAGLWEPVAVGGQEWSAGRGTAYKLPQKAAPGDPALSVCLFIWL